MNEKIEFLKRWAPAFDIWVRDKTASAVTQRYINQPGMLQTGSKGTRCTVRTPRPARICNSGISKGFYSSALVFRASYPKISEVPPSVVQLWLIFTSKPGNLNSAKCSKSYVTMNRRVKTSDVRVKKGVYQATERLLSIRNVSVVKRGESVVKKSPLSNSWSQLPVGQWGDTVNTHCPRSKMFISKRKWAYDVAHKRRLIGKVNVLRQV